VHFEGQGLPQALTQNRALVLRLGIIAFSILAIVLLAFDLSRPKTAAQMIAAGMSHTSQPRDLDPSDQNLDEDEKAAGAVWARAHPRASAADCPATPVPLHSGCLEAIGNR
jgi:hypothetical protein